MKRLKSLFIAGIVVLLLTPSIKAQIQFVEVKSESDWNQVLKLSSDSGKYIFLDIYATWCGPCKMIEQNVYTVKELGDYYNENFVNVKLDGESPFGSHLVAKFQLSGFPTMYYVDGGENVVNRQVGVRQADFLLSHGKKLVLNYDFLNISKIQLREKTLSTGNAKKYLSLLNELENKMEAARVSGYILNYMTPSEILDSKNKDLLLTSEITIDTRAFGVLSDSIGFLREQWTATEVKQLFENVFNYTLLAAIENHNEILIERMITDFLPVYIQEQPEMLVEAKYMTQKLYLANTSQWIRYDSLVNIEFQKTENDDKFLYQQAYEIVRDHFRNPVALDLSLKWMRNASEIEPSFDNLIFTAYVLAMKGENEEAEGILKELKQRELTEQQKKVINDMEQRMDQLRVG